MTELVFTPEGHKYSIDGVNTVSVTESMKMAGMVDTTWYTRWAAERGTAVHKAIQYHCEGDLDEESIPLDARPYFRAYLKFEAEMNWKAIEFELSVCDPTRDFAGTLDALGSIKKRLTIIDWKTGKPTRATGIQLTGYAIGLKATTGQLAQTLAAVWLRPDGTYRYYPFTFNPKVFLAGLEIAQWMRQK